MSQKDYLNHDLLALTLYVMQVTQPPESLHERNDGTTFIGLL